MMLRAEQLQAEIVRGEAVDADTLIRLSSEARRMFATVRKRARRPNHRPRRIPYQPRCGARR